MAHATQARPERVVRPMPQPYSCTFSPLCLSPFSVREIGPMIAPLYPGHQPQDVRKRQHAEG
jgi:hypothetical protein